MTVTIKLSEIQSLGIDRDQFAVRVGHLVAEAQAWADHMVKVKAGTAQKYPPPVESPLITKTITVVDDNGRQVFASDYEVVDDGPSAQEILTKKKFAHVHRVSTMERKMVELIDPPLRRRKRARMVASAAAKRSPEETQIASDIAAKGASASQDEKKFATAINAKPLRSQGDDLLLSEHNRRKDQIDAIDAWAADKLEEIDDLTIENVDSWSPGDPPFRDED